MHASEAEHRCLVPNPDLLLHGSHSPMHGGGHLLAYAWASVGVLLSIPSPLVPNSPPPAVCPLPPPAALAGRHNAGARGGLAGPRGGAFRPGWLQVGGARILVWRESAKTAGENGNRIFRSKVANESKMNENWEVSSWDSN